MSVGKLADVSSSRKRSRGRFFRRSEQRSNPLENPSVSLSTPAAWSWLIGGDNPTSAGEIINHHTAMQIVTVYTCVRLIAESIASLPLKVYERRGKGRLALVGHELYSLLTVAPNPEMTAFTWVENMAGCLVLTGNCYSEIRWSQDNQPAALYPLHPLLTEPFRQEDGTIAYRTTHGMSSGRSRVIQAKDILHVPLFSYDGLKGLSPVQQARQSLGLARAAEKHGARFFGNGSRPGGIMTTKSDLDETTQLNIRDSWERAQGGENSGRTAFLFGDWTYHQIGISNADAQFLEARQYQRADIATLFRVAPHMVGDTSRLSNSNAEQQSLSFVTDTLRPYLHRIEGEVARKLMRPQGPNHLFAEFDVRARLRGDFETAMKGYALGKQWGFMNTNHILAQLGKVSAGAAGDVFLTPANMVNSAKLLDPAYNGQLAKKLDGDL